MKIVHLSTQDYGGAGKAAFRLNLGLNKLGIDSKMVVLGKNSGDPSVKILPDMSQLKNFSCIEAEKHSSQILQAQWQKWAHTLAQHPGRPKGVELFSDTSGFTHLENCNEIKEADIINLHWVAGILNYNMMAEAFKGKTVIWTLHDMNAFTGGCHYASDCTKYKSICGACPQLGSVYIDDISERNWKLKKKVYEQLNLQIVTPSKWLAECARESTLFGQRDISVIPYGFPLDKFKLHDRTQLKISAGVNSEVKIILFGAESVVNQRKGFAFLLNALEKLEVEDPSKIKLGIFGSLPEEVQINSNFNVIKFGSISSEDEIAKIYSMADVFVIPSLEDNLPNTVVESMACGTPVVGFNTGGVPDMVTHLKTGYLAQLRDTEDLAEGIRTVLFDLDAVELSRNCSVNAKENYPLEKQAEEYLKLYNKRLNKTLQHFSEKTNLNKAETLIETGEYEKAKSVLLSLLEEDGNSVDVLNDLAVIYILQKDYDTAEEYLNSVLTIDNCNQIARENLRYIHENETRSNDARIGLKKNELPKISIVTPSFNQADFLEECILSVLSQGYPNLEYIVMDGGSTDGSLEIIKKYEEQITYWQSEPDGGQYAAIEVGLNKATGEILGWINSDDRMFPQSLQTIASIFIKNKNVEWITGRPSMFNEYGRQLFRINLPAWSQERYLNKDYKFIQQECTFWRTSLWKRAGSKMSTELQLAGDLELWTRFFRHAQLHSADSFLGGFRKQPQQKTSTQLNDYYKEAEKILENEIAEFDFEICAPGIAPLPIMLDCDFILPVQTDESSEIMLEQLDEALNLENFDSANNIFNRLIQHQPNSSELIQTYSEFLSKLGNTTDAKVLLWNYLSRADAPEMFYDKLVEQELRECRFDNALNLINKYKLAFPASTKYDSEAVRLTMIHKLFEEIAGSFNGFNSQNMEQARSRFNNSLKYLKYLSKNGTQRNIEFSLISESKMKEIAITVVDLMGQLKMDDAVQYLQTDAFNNEQMPKNNKIKSPSSNAWEVQVSAIVSTYNSEKFIKGCLDDLLEQTIYEKGELEIVVVNSGSDENEEAIVKEYQSKYSNIKYLKTENRETIYQAWNRGIKAANGKYVTNANTDDRHRPDAFEQMLAVFKSDETVDLVYADVFQTSQPNDNFYSSTIRKRTGWIDFDADLLLFGCYLGPQPMWKKSIHNEHGYFDESLKVVGDYEFWLRISRSANVRHIAEPLGLYLYSESSAEHRNQALTNEENISVQKKYFAEYLANEDDLRRVFHKLNEINKVFKNEQYFKAGMYFLNARKNGLELQNKIHEFAINFSAAYNGQTESQINSFINDTNSAGVIINQKLYLEILHSLLGSYGLMINDLEKAKQNFENALNYNPESSESCAGLGEVFFRKEILDAAHTMFEWAVKYDAENSFAKERLSQLKRDYTMNDNNYNKPEQSTHDQIEIAEQFIIENKLVEARNVLNGILDTSSDNIDALNDLSVVEIMNYNFLEAAQIISKILDVDPVNEIAIENLDYIKVQVDEQLTEIYSKK